MGAAYPGWRERRRNPEQPRNQAPEHSQTRPHPASRFPHATCISLLQAGFPDDRKPAQHQQWYLRLTGFTGVEYKIQAGTSCPAGLKSSPIICGRGSSHRSRTDREERRYVPEEDGRWNLPLAGQCMASLKT